VPEGGVFDDAAGYGSADSGKDGIGWWDGAVGAGFRLTALSGGPSSGADIEERAGQAPPLRVGEGSTSMVTLKWLLMLAGAALFGSAGALVAYDIYISTQLRRLLSRNKTDESGADLKVRAVRKPTRNQITWKAHFLGGHAGHDLR